jgi:selenocysteine-specific elongation factor
MTSIVVGTAGHIDHGKSALVRALTGIDPDRLKEEKDRGITIDLGFAHAVYGGVRFAFVDVPGHERFVKNMLAGIGGIDLVVLVVAADESVMPQTREHFEICRLLHVPSGVVALTKADLVDEEGLALVRLEVDELVAGSFLEGAPMVPVSARTGQGLDDLRRALAAAGRVRGRPAGGAPRLPIDRVFSMKGFGTVVTGTLVAGRIATGAELMLLPGGRRVAVRGVQVHGARRDAAVAGERAAINLGGIEVGEIERGQSLVAEGALQSTRRVDATLELLAGARPLKPGARVRFHQGTAEVLGRVGPIGPAPETDAIVPGKRGFVRLRLEEPAVLARGDRYILRAYSPPLTIGGGEILDPAPPAGAIRTSAALERCRRLDLGADAAEDAAAILIEEAGPRGLAAGALVWRAGLAPDVLEASLERLTAAGRAERVGPAIVAPRVLAELKASILAFLGRHHREQPDSDGPSREEVRMRLFRRGAPAVFDRAVEELARTNQVAARDRLTLAAHRIALSPEEERAQEAIETTLRDAGLTPPDAAALAARAGLPASAAERIVRQLQKQKRIVRIEGWLFHADVLAELKARIAGMKTEPATRIDVATFKETFGVTRKFAIPLLEYLDRERVTRRVGEARLIL